MLTRNSFDQEKPRFHTSILGVELRFACPDSTLLGEAKAALQSFFPFEIEEIQTLDTPHFFDFEQRDGQFLLTSEFGSQSLGPEKVRLLDQITSLARIVIAANAPELLFIHAGVVEWCGRGIVIPGDSHSGKTSLVRALVERGAVYFSDEYAVFDHEGSLHPFAKPLSIRGIEGQEKQTLVPATTFGQVAKDRSRADIVVLTKFQADAVWNPQRLTAAEGLLNLIPHTIGFANRPEFSLNYLNKALEKSVFFESERPDVEQFLGKFLETLDK